MVDLSWKTFFWIRCGCSKTELAKNREVFIVCFGPPSQSIRRGRISREGALDESRERRDKIVPHFSQEKQEKRNFGLKFSTVLSGIACCARESTSARQNLWQKQPKKKICFGGLWDSFFKSGPRIRFQWGIFILDFFGRGKTNFWGGDNFKTG